MQCPLRNEPLLVILASICLACPLAWGETGILVVHVKDVQRRPVAGLQIGVEGDGGSAITDSSGNARIKLAAQSTEKTLVSLQIVKSSPGQDLVIVSPWDYRTQVPSFKNESDNFVEVVVVQRGDRAALENGTVLKAAVSQINRANASNRGDKQAAQENPKANLEATAKRFGLTPEDLDKAIKAWSTKTTDPYDVGLAALYERNYNEATVDLQDSLKQRDEKLAADQIAVADAAFFLGSSLYKQGRYKESAAAYQRCLQIRPDDATVLNQTALSLILAGDYGAAEPLIRRAIAIDETRPGVDNQSLGTEVNNLALLLKKRRDYAAAEPLYRRALSLDESALGPNHPDVARDLNNLAVLLWERGDYAAAEPLIRRALAIDEKIQAPTRRDVARDLSNLALLLDSRGDYAAAVSLYRRVLAIDEKELAPDHPSLATDLNNLAGLLWEKGDYAAAEPLMRRAVAIDEKALGPDHPDTREYRENLDKLLKESAQAAARKKKN